MKDKIEEGKKKNGIGENIILSIKVRKEKIGIKKCIN